MCSSSSSRFHDRADAGRQLAVALASYTGRSDVRILALPRGGVPVAYQVACALRAPLDVFLVRKLGLPGYEELAMGAIASGGIVVLNHDIVRSFEVSEADIEAVIELERRELERRERCYRGTRPLPEIAGYTVVIVDDGLATGSTMQAAITALKQDHPEHLIVAVPVAAEQACDTFRESVDAVVCLETPEPFQAVGLWYESFGQTSDDEVRDLLDRATTCVDPPHATPVRAIAFRHVPAHGVSAHRTNGSYSD